MIDQLIFVLTVLCISGLIRGFYWLSKKDAASVWPEVIGEVREEAPGATFESLQSGVLNNDSDHYVYWTIEGKEYRKRLWDEASVAIGMFKVWRRTPELGPTTIRCNPDDPSQAFTAQEARAWREPVIGGVIVGVAAGPWRSSPSARMARSFGRRSNGTDPHGRRTTTAPGQAP